MLFLGDSSRRLKAELYSCAAKAPGSVPCAHVPPLRLPGMDPQGGAGPGSENHTVSSEPDTLQGCYGKRDGNLSLLIC